ncbi:MAG: DUF2231 domain-containing protein [Bdellovibrionales bacterium]|nr:DUF2231 domain-containing protein [Bdellovibrionales bacterium]
MASSYAAVKDVSVHRMLVKLPVASFLGAGVFDSLRWFTGTTTFSYTAFHLLGFGLVTGVVALGFGVHDWWSLPQGTREKTIAFGHGWLMIVTMMIFAYSFLLRFNNPIDFNSGGVSLSYGGIFVLMLGAYRGARLVSVHGAGTAHQTTAPGSGRARRANPALTVVQNPGETRSKPGERPSDSRQNLYLL